MRPSVLIFAVGVVASTFVVASLDGCTTEALAPGTDDGGVGDGAIKGQGNPQGNMDMSVNAGLVDLAQSIGGPPGTPCKSACDCQAGLACDFNGTCKAAPGGQSVYCCDSMNCPAGEYCQSTGGAYNRCPMMMGGGGSDAGMGMGMSCKTACDCPTGMACFNNQCINSMLGKLYCCESMTCPQGSYCQSQNGGNPMPCGGGGNPPPSDGGAMGAFWCQFIPCKDDQLCKTSTCVSCNPAGHCQ